MNSALGDAGENCNTAFWSGYYYCVGSDEASAAGVSVPTTTIISFSTIEATAYTTVSTIVSTIDVAPTSTSTTSTAAAVPVPTPSNAGGSTPSPTQSGIASLCAKYAQAHSGNTCSSFAAANQIAPADLYSRNTVLGAQGENCATKFWAGFYYCVGGTD